MSLSVTFGDAMGYSTKKAHSLTNRENIDPEILKEEQVIEASKKDIGQFEYLYNKYYEPIFRYVYHRTGDEHESADIASKIFMNAMNGLNKYECRGLPFGAWLFRIAANETKKHFRGKKTVVLYLDEQKLGDLWDCGEIAETGEKEKILRKMIDHLSDEEVAILQLKYFEEKNFKEIALLLDKKESAVKMKMYRSLNKLKLLYEKIDKQAK